MKKYILSFLLVAVAAVFLVSCSSSRNSSGSGTISFGLELKGVQGAPSEAPINCSTSGISTIEAVLYDKNGNYVKTGGPWPCTDHSGQITGIAAGSNYRIVINTRDSAGNILFSGEKTGITITAGQDTNTGTITLTPFIFWSINTIGATNVGLYSAIAHDSNNKIHIAFYNQGTTNLKYTTNASGSWVTSSVDTAGDVGQYPSIAVGPGSTVHISYYDATNTNLKYATYSSGTWTTTTVDSSTGVGKYSRIAVEPGNNNIHINYYDATNKHLKYAKRSGGVWTTETVDNSSFDRGQYSSLALDSSGKVHISYYDATNGYLMYANNVSGTWSVTQLDNAGNVGQYSAIVVDSSGYVHISYYDYTNEDLKYATNAPTGTWSTSVVDMHTTTYSYSISTHYRFGMYTSIAVDANNKVHIGYHETTYQASYSDYNYLYIQKYATNSAGAWITYTVDNITTTTSYSARTDEGWDSITVDTSGKVHISYYNAESASLKYATSAGSSWSTNSIDIAGNVGQYSSIAVDSANKSYISYYDSSQGDLKYLTDKSGAWATVRVDSAGTVGEYSSIAVDSNKNAHISYYDATKQILKYATNSLGSWATYTVDSAGNVGTFSSIAVDSNKKVHISYYDVDNKNLNYATNSSGSWSITPVDSAGDVGEHTSIAVDSSGYAYIAYSDASGDLKYATNSSGAWDLSTVETGTTTNAVQYQHVSLKLDSLKKAHISYYDSTNGDLKYATNASGAWVTTVLDSAGDVGKFSSLALDGSGKIHISYYDATNADLRYATNCSGSWLIYTLDSGGDVGQYSSIAVDGSNKLHISYYDATNQDLKVATNTVGIDGSLSDQTPPSPPGGLTATPVSTSQINLAWNDSRDDIAVAGYKIYKNGTLLSTATGTSFSDTVLSPYTQGCYKVSAYDAANNESIGTAEVCATTYLMNGTAIPDTMYANYFDLALDATGNAHITYNKYNNATYDYSIMYATNSFSSWATTTLNSSNNNSLSSLAVDLNGNSHVNYMSYAYGAGYTINYLEETSPGTWSGLTAIDNCSQQMSPAIAVDSSGNTHIVYNYYDGAFWAIKYASDALGSWSTTTLVATYSSRPSIAIDSTNNVHVAYTSGSDLVHAVKPAGLTTWATSTVDTATVANYWFSDPSIDVDSNGYAHISYYDGQWIDNAYHIKYATNASGDWVTTTIDVGGSGSIAVDRSNNKVHILYSSTGIMYTTFPRGSVDSRATYSIVNAGGPARIKVDLTGKVHILSYDNTTQSLIYLTCP